MWGTQITPSSPQPIESETQQPVDFLSRNANDSSLEIVGRRPSADRSIYETCSINSPSSIQCSEGWLGVCKEA
ncbi:MAG TPA: hypothetical protein DDX19_18225 [Rhodopirellula baltica]|uniref:Uncharacterized protein n=1 Tax=Rhodopirellula baltica (strain DSM 10527 / NCIMB 13988 / SH1) TaxID=243090 RepID=Q7USM8_RHOBA|nr:hypothetical protein RB4407 [Rhodopirellula baltica SH 1]HBE64643.1 hypothetical protein [Rhodopirellula baltica]